MLLASAAIPNLFRVVEVEGRFYWDGLFSHNPPLLSLLEEKPAEIWVIQINPPQRCKLPRSVEETHASKLDRSPSFLERLSERAQWSGWLSATGLQASN